MNLYSTQHLDGIIKFCSLLGIEEKIIIWTGWYNWIIYEEAFLLYTRCSFQSIKGILYDRLCNLVRREHRIFVCKNIVIMNSGMDVLHIFLLLYLRKTMCWYDFIIQFEIMQYTCMRDLVSLSYTSIFVYKHL